MKGQLFSVVALSCIAVISCEFQYIRTTDEGNFYSYNGRRYIISDQLHRSYQANPENAERLFVSELKASSPSRIEGQSNDRRSDAGFVDRNQSPTNNGQTTNRRTDAGFVDRNQSPTNNGQSPNRRTDAGFVDRNQSPTNEEILNSQNFQSFRPNKPNSASNIYFPSSPTSGLAQPPSQNLPQSSRPLATSLPSRDSIPTLSENSNFVKPIPRERDRENNRNPTAAVTDFAWNLFKASNNVPNFVLSPLSPQILMSYLAYVADGQTRDELVNVNGFGNPDQLQTLVSSMLSDGSSRELQIATAFFISQEMRLNKQFQDKSVDNVDIVPVDFKRPEAAGRTVSQWAKSKTKGALKLNNIDFAPSTKIALTSALYFKGKFVYTFQKAQPGIFHAPERAVQVEMMNMKRNFRWGKLGNYAEWVAIPYESSDSLVIILPNAGLNIDVIIRDMTSKDIDGVIQQLETESSKANVNVTLPKFKLESTTSLVLPLKKMGIESIFSQQAELPYLSDYDSVQVTNAQQQASIDVNEEGTVLVAFTNLNVVALSFQLPVPEVEFNVNRPFIAIIADSKRKIPYCMAKITSPLA